MTNTDKDYYRETTAALEAILHDQAVQDYDLLSHIAGILADREQVAYREAIDAARPLLNREVWD